MKITRWLFVASLFYAAAIIWTAVVSYWNYSEYIDLSYYHIALQQLAQFQVPFIWDTGIPVWAQHFSPIWFLLVPFYWVGARAGFLVFIQASIGVGAMIPLYFFARTLTKSSFVATCIVWSYLLFGGIQSSIYYGVHEVTFFPFFLFSSLWAWSRKKYWLYVLFFILMLVVKEEIAFIGIALGIYLLCTKSWKYGVTAIGLGIAWGIISFGTISYFHHGGYEYWGQFLGGSWRVGITDRKPLMLIESFGSFGFLPLLFLPNFIVLLPVLAMKLLSNDIVMMNSFHYSATYGGLLVLSVVSTMTYVIQEKHRIFVGWVILAMACLGSLYYGYGYYYGQFPRMTLHNIRLENFVVDNQSGERDSATRMIPSVAAVGCQYQLCSHIERPYGALYPIPGPVVPEYLIVDTALPIPLKTNAEIKSFFSASFIETYSVIYEKGTILVLRRKLSLQ